MDLNLIQIPKNFRSEPWLAAGPRDWAGWDERGDECTVLCCLLSHAFNVAQRSQWNIGESRAYCHSFHSLTFCGYNTSQRNTCLTNWKNEISGTCFVFIASSYLISVQSYLHGIRRIFRPLNFFHIFVRYSRGVKLNPQRAAVSAGFCGFLSISCQLRPADQGVSIF